MDEERLRRVVDALSQPEREMRVALLAASVREKVAAGLDERSAVREAAGGLGPSPPDPAALERAIDEPPLPAARLWGAVVSLVLSSAVVSTMLTLAPRFKGVFESVD